MTACKRCGGSGEEPGSTHRPPTWQNGTPIDLNDPAQRLRWKRFNYMDSNNHPVLYPEPERPAIRLVASPVRLDEETA